MPEPLLSECLLDREAYVLRYPRHTKRQTESEIHTVAFKPVPEERWRLPPRGREAKSVTPQKPPATRYRWRALLGLALVYAALGFDLYTLWAVVLLWWAATDIVKRETWFMETVKRAENAVVYWLLICTWLGFSALLVLLDVNPGWRS